MERENESGEREREEEDTEYRGLEEGKRSIGEG